jgi:hypothetical protein
MDLAKNQLDSGGRYFDHGGATERQKARDETGPFRLNLSQFGALELSPMGVIIFHSGWSRMRKDYHFVT